MIGADVLALAMRLLSGELQSFEITSDMVGKTLIHEGGVHLVEGKVPQPGVKPAGLPAQPEAVLVPAVGEGRSVAASGGKGSAAKRRDLVLTALRIDPKAWLTHVEIADLVEDEAGYASRKSALYSLKCLLENMHRDGDVETRENGGRVHYRLSAR